jgi:hypothetical protein
MRLRCLAASVATIISTAIRIRADGVKWLYTIVCMIAAFAAAGLGLDIEVKAIRRVAVR